MPDISLKPVKALSLTFGIILISFLPIGFVSGWGNGKSGCSYADNNLSYDYECNFGTHDWIAKAALNALLEENSSKWSWLSGREKIYLVGTEAPDNSAVNMTLNGVNVEGFGDTTYHHIYFNEDGTVKNSEDDAALRAKWAGDWADVYFNDNKLDLAAFYLGVMTHYISDCSMFSHTTENNVPPHNMDFDTYHSTIEGYVRTRTNEISDLEEFFQVFSFSVGNKKPYDAAISLAWDTYNDPNPSESIIRDAVWLHNNHFTDWKQTFSTRDDDTTTNQLYYDRIEENLNNAIQVCAATINNITGLMEIDEIDLIPIADFTANSTIITRNSNFVQFEFIGSYGDFPPSFQWDFGDSSLNSTDPNPIHQYSEIGDYSVTLMIIDQDGDADVIVKGDYISYIDLIPEVDFTANFTLINMSSNSVQFEFNGSFGDIPTEFQWNFGDGSTNSTERNPIHNFNSPGNYTIILTILDVDGDEDNIIKKDYIQVISEDSPQIFGYDLSYLVGFVFFTILTISNKIKKKIRK